VRGQRITQAWAHQKVGGAKSMVFLQQPWCRHRQGRAHLQTRMGTTPVQVGMAENPYRLARDIRGIAFPHR